MWPSKCPRRSAYCDLTESSSGLVSLFEGRSRTACHIRCQTTCMHRVTFHKSPCSPCIQQARECMTSLTSHLQLHLCCVTFSMPRFDIYGDTCTNKRSASGTKPSSQSPATLTIWHSIKSGHAYTHELACSQAPKRCRFCC